MTVFNHQLNNAYLAASVLIEDEVNLPEGAISSLCEIIRESWLQLSLEDVNNINMHRDVNISLDVPALANSVTRVALLAWNDIDAYRKSHIARAVFRVAADLLWWGSDDPNKNEWAGDEGRSHFATLLNVRDGS